jgi:hypothetical protein
METRSAVSKMTDLPSYHAFLLYTLCKRTHKIYGARNADSSTKDQMMNEVWDIQGKNGFGSEMFREV